MRAAFQHFLRALLAVCLPHLAACAGGQAAPPTAAQRVIILTDIEADPDDTQSLVRLLLYSNEIEIEGLIATTSVFQKERTAPDSIRAVIEAYGEVKPNLDLHAPGYPAAGTLLGRIRSGLPVYGMNGVGPDMDSEGSDWIIRRLEEDDARPLWISIWGGPNALAQALYRIRETRSEDDARRLINKLRVYAISDQDDSGAWIRTNFPDLFYIVSPGGQGNATWFAMTKPQAGDDTDISARWLSENIQQGHGPLGAVYPGVIYGLEGDTPAFLGLVPNGLNVPEHPDWGGWGGRYELYTPDRARTDPDGWNGGVPVLQETRAIWTNAVDTYAPRVSDTAYRDNRVTIWRWRGDFQNDFAARIDWTVHPLTGANHPPLAQLAHPAELTVQAGQTFTLDAGPSSDPDGDGLSFLWFNYPEAGSLDVEIPVSAAGDSRKADVVAPDVAQSETAHFILRVTDSGAPPLARYQRVVVTIEPAQSP